MKVSKTMQFTAIALVAGMVALFAAGCGGGGGGAAAPATRSGLMLNIELPRTAGVATDTTYYDYDYTCTDCGDYVYLAEISVLEYGSDGSSVTVAETDTLLTWDSVTEYYTGDFFIDGLVDDYNLVVKVVCTEYTEDSSTGQLLRTANSLTVPAYLGSIVEEVYQGTTAYVDVTPKTTLATLVAIFYAMEEGVALSDTSVMTPTLLDTGYNYILSVYDEYPTATSTATITPYDVVHGSSDPFTVSNWSATLAAQLQILANEIMETDTSDTTAPTVLSHTPTNGGSVGAYMPTFAVVFSESMDSTVNLNDPTTLASTSFTLTIAKSGGSSLTITQANASQYGIFTWMTTTVSNDTLSFTMYDKNTLENNGLSTLLPDNTYTISSWVAPSIVTDLAGNAVDTTSVISMGSFTTTDDVPPSFINYSPSVGTTVDPNSVVISMIFDETLDSSIDLNSQTVLDSGQIAISLTSSAGTSVSITQANALQYGTFSYATNYYTDDTVVFTMYSPTTLQANGLSYPQNCGTYTLSVSVPAAPITDMGGNAPAGASESGTVYTSCP